MSRQCAIWLIKLIQLKSHSVSSPFSDRLIVNRFAFCLCLNSPATAVVEVLSCESLCIESSCFLTRPEVRDVWPTSLPVLPRHIQLSNDLIESLSPYIRGRFCVGAPRFWSEKQYIGNIELARARFAKLYPLERP